MNKLSVFIATIFVSVLPIVVATVGFQVIRGGLKIINPDFVPSEQLTNTSRSFQIRFGILLIVGGIFVIVAGIIGGIDVIREWLSFLSEI